MFDGIDEVTVAFKCSNDPPVSEINSLPMKAYPPIIIYVSLAK